MYVWFGESETGERERKERTHKCVCLGIRASTGDPPQMGDTLDILSHFTTHSSNCLFTSRYVRVCLCDVCISVCPCLYIYLHILCVRSCLTVHGHVNIVYVCVRVCVCLAALHLYQLPVMDPSRLFAFQSDGARARIGGEA